MRSSWITAGAALAVCASVTAGSTAEARKRRAGATQGIELGAFVGAHDIPTSTSLANRDTVDNQSTTPAGGASLGLRLGFRLHPRLALEVEGEAVPTTTRDNRDSGVVIGYRAQLQGRLAGPDSRFRPFLVLGAGAHTAVLDRLLETQVDTAFVGTAGAGLEIALSRGFALRLDARTYVGAGAGDASAAFDTHVVFGMCWSPQGACGYQAPGEDDSKPVGDLGGPQRDGDEDKIFGVADRCPIEPEDKDGFEDLDGCPDPDDDLDGVLDDADRCRREPETRNGWEDGDGCPDQLPEELRPYEGVVAVSFREGGAVMLPQSMDLLDLLVWGLEQHPDVAVVIEVVMPETKPVTTARRIVNERAAAVRQYLLDKKVPAARVKATGRLDAKGGERVEVRFAPAE